MEYNRFGTLSFAFRIERPVQTHHMLVLKTCAVVCWLIGGIIVSPVWADEPLTIAALESRTFALTQQYFAQFQHPKTHVLYGARLSTKSGWTKPEDVKARKPKPWGYGSRIADTSLHCGHMLVALLDAHEAAPDPFLGRSAEELFSALKFIGGVCPVEGLVPRGPHPDDPTAYYDDSSMDQHTTYIIALARYANSKLASEEDKQWIARKLNAIGHRLEKHNFSIKAADGVTQSHVGFSWMGFRNNHVSILIPTLYALYRGTGNEHWLKRHDQFLAEREGLRWKLLHPGAHVELNGHPIYANQNGFRLNAYLRFLSDEKKRAIIGDLLAQSAAMQLERDFPGPMYRRFHPDERWRQLAKKYRWKGAELSGAEAAWKRFRPELLDKKDGLAALAHVRFPLGGYHLVLMSEQSELIERHLPTIWKMLSTVDLDKIEAAETHYLFAAVALHAYAYRRLHPELLAETDNYGPPLKNSFNAGIGPTMDVTIADHYAFAVGNRALHVLDIANPGKPRRVGSLEGLGNVRQIVVDDGMAFITSREDGLFIVDVRDVTAPKLRARHDTIEFATGVCKSGDVLFVACRTFGVELIDVSNPASPEHVSTVRTGEAQSVVERNGYLYAGVWGSSEVVTVDVRDPWRPKVTARTPLDGFGDGVDVRGQYLYVATGHHSRRQPRSKPGDPGYGNGHGLEVLDISEPAKPKRVAGMKFPSLYNIRHDMWGVTIVNEYAFVADTHNGVFVLDVRNPRRPVFAGHWTLPKQKGEPLPRYVAGLAPGKEHIYVAGGASDLHVLSAPQMSRIPDAEIRPTLRIPESRPQVPDERFRSYRVSEQVYGVDFLDDIAIVGCGDAGVHVLEVFPRFKTLSITKTTGRVTDVFVAANQVYVAEGSGGLGIYRLDSGKLQEIGRYRVRGASVRHVEVPGDARYALLQIGVHKIQIVDVSNPSAPRKMLEDQHHGLLYGDQLMRGLVDGRHACAFWHVSGLHWYDLKADGGPRYSGDNFPGRTGSANGLISMADTTLATTRGGYVLLDRDERRPLSDVPLHRLGTKREHLGKPTIDGKRLYAVNRRTGRVTIADITNRKQPKLIEQFEVSGNPSRCLIYNDVLVIPAGYQGLLVFDR